jgi:hypothetical protein
MIDVQTAGVASEVLKTHGINAHELLTSALNTLQSHGSLYYPHEKESGNIEELQQLLDKQKRTRFDLNIEALTGLLRPGQWRQLVTAISAMINDYSLGGTPEAGSRIDKERLCLRAIRLHVEDSYPRQQ